MVDSWLPLAVTQPTVTLLPTFKWLSWSLRSVGEVTVAPLNEVITSPTASPAA